MGSTNLYHNTSRPLEALTKPTCVVLMPCSPLRGRIFEANITPVITAVGMTAVRFDQLPSHEPRLSTTWRRLREAQCVVVDLSKRHPTVFYELGRAHALGKPTVLITEPIEDVPYELRHLSIIRYSPSQLVNSFPPFQDRLVYHLRQMQKEGRESLSSSFHETDLDATAEGTFQPRPDLIALLQGAQLALSKSQVEAAELLLLSTADRFQADGDSAGRGTALRILGTLYVNAGDYHSAQRAFEQSLEALKHANDPRGEAVACGNLAFIYEVTADYQRAK